MPVHRIGMQDRYGESGEPKELFKHFNLDGASIAKTVQQFIDRMPRYHQ